MQTVLSSRHLKRVVDEIRKKEAASWPAGRRGREDSLRYVDALARAKASVQERSRRQGNRQDRRQGLLIEFILSDRESLVAISEPEVEEDGNGHFLVASKRPVAVLPLSRTYVRGNFYEIAGDALGLEGTEAAELLEPLLPPGAREGAEAPAEGKTGKYPIMKLIVATNFDPLLVEAVRGYPVVELFGKLREDAVGGGRAPYQLAPVTRKGLAGHVRLARDAGIGFNYLLNAACLGNREITRTGQAEIEELCGWLVTIGVSSVTVSSPYLLRLVKSRFPSLAVRVSVFGGVDRVRKAQMWEEMGADGIVLDSLLVNREFATLARIRKAVRCDLALLVNNNCLSSCALSPAHMNALAHAGQSWHGNRGFFIDWCFLKCTEMKLRDPVNYVRSEWIRPEDL
jgi:hypothetical protein